MKIHSMHVRDLTYTLLLKKVTSYESSQKSYDKSVSAKYTVSKARTPNPLETRIQNFHDQCIFQFLLLASLHFFIWWNTIQHYIQQNIQHHSRKSKNLVY